MSPLKGKSLLSIKDLSVEEIQTILETAEKFKKGQISGKPLEGKSLAMVFQKTSTRTRVSFEVAMTQLGGHALFLNAEDIQLKKEETIEDTARVLSRYVDAIMVRVHQKDLEKIARTASVPVINGLTNLLHPCQILGDLLTVKEHKGRLKGLKLTFMGDGGNNTLHSWLYAGPKVGMDIAIGCPPEYEPNPKVLGEAKRDAKRYGTKIEIIHDPARAVEGADVIYTDTFVSLYVDKAEEEQRLKLLARYQVNSSLVSKAKKDAIVMHCLPAHRGQEITDEVIDDEHSVVFDEAENRLHVQKAILYLILG
jgi:ornithine carbamoyltransferase